MYIYFEVTGNSGTLPRPDADLSQSPYRTRRRHGAGEIGSLSFRIRPVLGVDRCQHLGDLWLWLQLQ